MAPLVILPAAWRDLIEIGDYIALDNVERAASFIAEIEAEIASIAEQPKRFPSWADVMPGLRAARHGRYMIFFMEENGEVLIVRILHGSRDIATILRAGGSS